MTRIGIEGLCVSFGGTRVIDGLSLDIPPGAFFTLLGPAVAARRRCCARIAGFVPVAGALFFDAMD